MVTIKERPPDGKEIWVFFLTILHTYGQNAINHPFLHKIWTEEGFFDLMLPQNTQENSKNTLNISLPGSVL